MNYYVRLVTVCGCERLLRWADRPTIKSITIPFFGFGKGLKGRVFESDFDGPDGHEQEGDNVTFFTYREKLDAKVGKP